MVLSNYAAKVQKIFEVHKFLSNKMRKKITFSFVSKSICQCSSLHCFQLLAVVLYLSSASESAGQINARLVGAEEGYMER